MDIILIFGIILVISTLSCKSAGKIGLPVLVGFILIGVLIGNFIKFDEMFNDMGTVKTVSDFALLIIVFTGGFQTNFSEAKPVLGVSSVLSIGGTLLTGLLAGGFAYFVLGLSIKHALLLGAIIAPTDVASVFSVLRSKQTDLKNHLGDLLELESGSNEAFAHILMAVMIAVVLGSPNVPLLFIIEIVVGIIAGVLFGKLGQILMNWLNVEIDGLYGVLLCGIAFLIYGTAAQFQGSGFLAVYIGGMILGNGKLVYKGFLSRLFSALSMLMQIILFILLGILCIPALASVDSIPEVMLGGMMLALFLLLVARPVTVFSIMKPFKRPMNEIALVSWAGFRGASSIVFATHVLIAIPDDTSKYIVSMVFFVCMVSVIAQSPFIVLIAKKLKLLNE